MTNKLKTTKLVLKPITEKYVNASNPDLDVCAYVKSYMLETSKFRNENHIEVLHYPLHIIKEYPSTIF